MHWKKFNWKCIRKPFSLRQPNWIFLTNSFTKIANKEISSVPVIISLSNTPGFTDETAWVECQANQSITSILVLLRYYVTTYYCVSFITSKSIPDYLKTKNCNPKYGLIWIAPDSSGRLINTVLKPLSKYKIMEIDRIIVHSNKTNLINRVYIFEINSWNAQ